MVSGPGGHTRRIPSLFQFTCDPGWPGLKWQGSSAQDEPRLKASGAMTPQISLAFLRFFRLLTGSPCLVGGLGTRVPGYSGGERMCSPAGRGRHPTSCLWNRCHGRGDAGCPRAPAGWVARAGESRRTTPTKGFVRLSLLNHIHDGHRSKLSPFSPAMPSCEAGPCDSVQSPFVEVGSRVFDFLSEAVQSFC